MSPTPQVSGANVRSVTLRPNGSLTFTLNGSATPATTTSTSQSTSTSTGGSDYQGRLNQLNQFESQLNGVKGKAAKGLGAVKNWIATQRNNLMSEMASKLNQIQSNPWQTVASMLGFGNNQGGLNLGNMLQAFNPVQNILSNLFRPQTSPLANIFGGLGNLGQTCGNAWNSASNGVGNLWNNMFGGGFGNTLGYNNNQGGFGGGGWLRNSLAAIGLGFLRDIFNRGQVANNTTTPAPGAITINLQNGTTSV